MLLMIKDQKPPELFVTANSTTETEVEPKNKVRSFRTIPINSKTKNLILGSSIIARINPYDLPEDIEIQAYSGSTTEEKADVTKIWEKVKLETITIQNGTNDILKHKHESAEQMFKKHKSLVQSLSDRHNPFKVFICEVPPVIEDDQLVGCNKKIEDFNQLLNDYCESKEILPVHETLTIQNNWKSFYHKSIHFNDSLGTLLLKNILLSHILRYSNNVLRSRKRNSQTNDSTMTYADSSGSQSQHQYRNPLSSSTFNTEAKLRFAKVATKGN